MRDLLAARERVEELNCARDRHYGLPAQALDAERGA